MNIFAALHGCEITDNLQLFPVFQSSHMKADGNYDQWKKVANDRKTVGKTYTNMTSNNIKLSFKTFLY